jgi:hypothetical protein
MVTREIERHARPRLAMVAKLELDLINKVIEVGLQRTENKGDYLLLYLTDIKTGEIEVILWEDAPRNIQAAATEWGCDPLELISRYSNTSWRGQKPVPFPPSPKAA